MVENEELVKEGNTRNLRYVFSEDVTVREDGSKTYRSKNFID